MRGAVVEQKNATEAWTTTKDGKAQKEGRMKVMLLLVKLVLTVVSLGSGIYGVWTFAPGHEINSIYYLALAIWLQPNGGSSE